MELFLFCGLFNDAISDSDAVAVFTDQGSANIVSGNEMS